MHRKHVTHSKARHEFKKRVNMTHKRNTTMPLRGGIRL